MNGARQNWMNTRTRAHTHTPHHHHPSPVQLALADGRGLKLVAAAYQLMLSARLCGFRGITKTKQATCRISKHSEESNVALATLFREEIIWKSNNWTLTTFCISSFQVIAGKLIFFGHKETWVNYPNLEKYENNTVFSPFLYFKCLAAHWLHGDW